MLDTAGLVARIRAATGETQESLARRLGVSFPTVNAWERGRSTPRTVHRRQLEQLAQDLGIEFAINILVIDDDPTTSELIEAAAQDVDGALSVHSALDGWEGLLRCGSLQPALLFLDIMMPGIDGLEVARRIPEIEGLDRTAVFFVTSSRDRGVLDRARSLGRGVLLKPIDLDEVSALMRQLISPTQRSVSR